MTLPLIGPAEFLFNIFVFPILQIAFMLSRKNFYDLSATVALTWKYIQQESLK